MDCSMSLPYEVQCSDHYVSAIGLEKLLVGESRNRRCKSCRRWYRLIRNEGGYNVVPIVPNGVQNIFEALVALMPGK